MVIIPLNLPEKSSSMQDDRTAPFEKPFIFRRSSMDALADVLLAEVHDEVGESGFFSRKRIIVPNRSIQRYLSLRFAHRYGIAAQLEFPSLMSVFQRFLPQGHVRPDINGKTIGWRIYRVMQEPGAEMAFPQLARWIRGDSRRLYDLSRQLGTSSINTCCTVRAGSTHGKRGRRRRG